jgi:hypothetical protein
MAWRNSPFGSAPTPTERAARNFLRRAGRLEVRHEGGVHWRCGYWPDLPPPLPEPPPELSELPPPLPLEPPPLPELLLFEPLDVDFRDAPADPLDLARVVVPLEVVVLWVPPLGCPPPELVFDTDRRWPEL